MINALIMDNRGNSRPFIKPYGIFFITSIKCNEKKSQGVIFPRELINEAIRI